MKLTEIAYALLRGAAASFCLALLLNNVSPAIADPAISLSIPAWQVGQEGHLQGAGYAPGKIEIDATVEGKQIWDKSIAVGSSGRFAITIPITQIGYYTLNAGDAPPANFAVVPIPSVGQGRSTSLADPDHRLLLGICTHFAQRTMPPVTDDILKNLGVDFVRDELPWGVLSKSPGVYDFPAKYDTYVKNLAKNNIKLLFVADYQNAAYGKGAPFIPGGSVPFGDYVSRVLGRYGDEIMAVEVYNEPNAIDPIGKYLPVLRDTYTQVRAAGFTQPIIAVGGAGIGGGMNPDYAGKIFAAGAAAYCNGFSQHPYTSPWAPDLGYPCNDGDNHNANLDIALSRSAGLLKSYSKSRGGWITEIGWPSPLVVSETKQAAFIARTILVVSSYKGMEGLSTYDFQDDGPDPNNKEHHFGLVRQDLTPKPAYQAYAVTASFLRNKTFVRRLVSPDSPLWANIYKDDKGAYWVACWATETTLNGTALVAKSDAVSKKAVNLQQKQGMPNVPFHTTTAPGAFAYDWEGRPLHIGTTLTASPLPIYIDTKLKSDTITLYLLPGAADNSASSEPQAQP